MRGNEVYRDINRNVKTAQADFDRIGEELERTQTEIESARAEEARQLGRLARVRLEELAASRVAGGLDAADRQALQHLEERRQAIQDIRQRIIESDAKQRELTRARDAARDVLDEARDVHGKQIEETLLKLGQTEEYEAQLARVERATNHASRANEKAEVAEADRETKRKPYEKDKLFTYLWKRRFRFPEYRAWPLFRTLDGWVASLCGYLNAHRDYMMLLEIPKRLRGHAEGLVEAASKEAEILAGIEQVAFQRDGVFELAKISADAEAALANAEDELQTEEQREEQLQRERAALEAGEDAHSKNALGTLSRQIAHEDVATLKADARRTDSPEDDAAALAIGNLRRQQDDLEGEVEELRQKHDKAMSTLKEIQQLRRRFRQRGYDSRDSVFDSDFNLGDALGGLLHGALRMGDVWGMLNRHQRWRRRRRTTSGAGTAFDILGGILSSGSSSSTGGFGGGGMFGGGGSSSSGGGFGGFSTGGGFGGGSGFSTGGGF